MHTAFKGGLCFPFVVADYPKTNLSATDPTRDTLNTRQWLLIYLQKKHKIPLCVMTDKVLKSGVKYHSIYLTPLFLLLLE